MRDDLEAALRLSSSLLCRTVKRKPVVQAHNPEHIGVGKGGHQGRKIVLNGKVYDNMTLAKKACGLSFRTIYEWLANGKAKFL